MRLANSFAALTVILSVPYAASAQQFRADNRLLVRPLDNARFEVLYRGGALDNAYWCAAADYVIDGRRLASRTQLFRASPLPRKQGQGIVFTLDPAQATPEPGLSVFGGRDGTVSAGHARRAFCDASPLFGFP